MSQTSVPQTHPPGRGWRDWISYPPTSQGLIEAWRQSWQEVIVIRVEDLHPGFNVHGVRWRPIQPPRYEPELSVTAP